MSMLASTAGYFCLASNIYNQSEKWLKTTTIPIPTCSLRAQPQKNYCSSTATVAQTFRGWWEGQESSDAAFEKDTFPATVADSPCRLPALALILIAPH